MAKQSPCDINDWNEHSGRGGGVFPGEVCVEWKGMLVRDVMNEKGKGFKTEFNLETMTYQFYSVCEWRNLKAFVEEGMRYIFPVGGSPPKCFGVITVEEYVEEPVPDWLKNCISCGGKQPPGSRYILKLGHVHLVSEKDAFPINQAVAWRDHLKRSRPKKRRINETDADTASRLAAYLSRKKDVTSEVMSQLLERKREFKKRLPEFLAGSSLSEEKRCHLEGLRDKTDYFEHT